MELQGVITRVQNLFGDSRGVIITPAMILDWVNDAHLDIVRETQYLSTNNTSPANFFIGGNPIGDMVLLKRVMYGTKPLAMMDVESIDRLGMRESAPGIPQGYYMDGESVFLFPDPLGDDETEVNVIYVVAPTEYTDPGDLLDVPIRYHTDVVTYCIGKAHERNENYRAAEMYAAKFMSGVAQRRFESLTQDDSFTVVGSDYEDEFYQTDISGY